MWKRLVVSTMIFFCNDADAQIRKWDGSAGDGQWSTVSNWANDSLPSMDDTVVFDNSFVSGNYNVLLPAGNFSVNIKYLIITPSASVIQVRVPNANAAVPALNLAAIKLFDGAVFINSSGLSSTLGS